MADDWKKLGDTVAELVRLHNVRQREEAAYREKAFQLGQDNARLRAKLVEEQNKNLELATDLARLRREACTKHTPENRRPN